MLKPKYPAFALRHDLGPDEQYTGEVKINRSIHAEVYYGWRCVPNAMAASIIMGFNLGCLAVLAVSKLL